MFGFGKKKTETAVNSSTANPINSNLNNVGNIADNSENKSKVILDKAKVSLDKHIVSLQKDKGINLSFHKARVVVVLDRSGSMSSLFRNGSVQNTLTRLLPLALRFDDDGSLESYVFNTGYQELQPMNLSNYDNYVKKCIMNEGHSPSGGTSYSPVINAVVKRYNDGSKFPTFVVFITDGENDDKLETDNAIIKSAKHNIFFQFIGIGANRTFKYLEKLDDLKGRECDNTGFIQVIDMDSLDDDHLFQVLLEQYIEWLRVKRFI